MSVRNVLFRYVFHEFFLYLIRSVGGLRHETESVADAKHMRVYSHGWLSECHGQYNVSRLPSHAREPKQFNQTRGHQADVSLHQGLGHLSKMPCLCVRIGNTLHVFQNFVCSGLGKALCRRVSVEEGRGHLVDALVCALCAQYHGYKQLEYASELKFGVHHRHLLPEVFKYPAVSLFFPHFRSCIL